MGALLTSTLVGVVCAAFVLPPAVGAGMAARESAEDYLVLPADLDEPELLRRSRILAQDGALAIKRELTKDEILAPIPEHRLLRQRHLRPGLSGSARGLRPAGRRA